MSFLLSSLYVICQQLCFFTFTLNLSRHVARPSMNKRGSIRHGRQENAIRRQFSQHNLFVEEIFIF